MQESMQKELGTEVAISQNDKLSFYEACVKGKMAKQKSDTGKEKRAKRKLELIHSESCGRMQAVSHNGKLLRDIH